MCLRACAIFCTYSDSSNACAKSHTSICSPMMYFIVSNDSASGQRRPWSDCADAQADLGLRWLPMPEGTFWHGAAHVTYILVLEDNIFKQNRLVWYVMLPRIGYQSTEGENIVWIGSCLTGLPSLIISAGIKRYKRVCMCLCEGRGWGRVGGGGGGVCVCVWGGWDNAPIVVRRSDTRTLKDVNKPTESWEQIAKDGAKGRALERRGVGE